MQYFHRCQPQLPKLRKWHFLQVTGKVVSDGWMAVGFPWKENFILKALESGYASWGENTAVCKLPDEILKCTLIRSFQNSFWVCLPDDASKKRYIFLNKKETPALSKMSPTAVGGKRRESSGPDCQPFIGHTVGGQEGTHRGRSLASHTAVLDPVGRWGFC